MNRRILAPLMILWALAAILVAGLGSTPLAIQVVLGLPLALFFPGYSILSALPSGALGREERIVIAFGVSMAALVVGGAILQVLAVPLTTFAWAVLLGGTTIAGTVISLTRRRPVTAASPSLTNGAPLVTARQGLLFALAVLLVVAAMAVSVFGVSRQPATVFTELWMLPGEIGDTVRVGVRNFEGTDMTYHLDVFSGGPLIQAVDIPSLADGHSWEETLTLPVIDPTHPEVLAQLYVGGHAAPSGKPYREVSFWRGAGWLNHVGSITETRFELRLGPEQLAARLNPPVLTGFS